MDKLNDTILLTQGRQNVEFEDFFSIYAKYSRMTSYSGRKNRSLQ